MGAAINPHEMELAVENPRHMSVVKIGETPAPSGAAREELLALARDWLLADPDLPFRRARKAAKNLSLALTSRLYAEARRSLGITAGPPRPSQRKPAPVVAAEFTKDAPMAAAEKTKTPMMAFVVEYLRSAPDATYADLKSAAAQKGFKIAPIVFGRARKELGFSAMRDAKPARTATRNPAAVAAAQVASPAAQPRRRGPAARSGFGGDLAGMLGRLQGMASERDRFHAALQQIARVLRDVL